MSKSELRPEEKLLAKEYASHITKMLFLPQPNPGKLTVTNQRVIFGETRLKAAFEYELSDIASFSLSGASLVLNMNNGNSHTLTGMYNKKLAAALTEANVKQQ